MARLFDDASSQSLDVNATPITAVPLTMACWVRVDTTAVEHGFLFLGDKDAETDYFQLMLSTDAKLYAITRSSAAFEAATSAGTLAVDTWAHVAATYASTTNRNTWVNGVAGTPNVAGVTPAGLDRISIGRLGRNSPAHYLSGRAAEAAIWNVELSANEMAALARGVSPRLIRPLSLKGYWPIWGFQSPEIDLSGLGNNLTLNGSPALANGPPVVRFSWWRPTAEEVVAAGGSTVPAKMHQYRQRRVA